VAADEFWLSPAYGRDSLGIHFTWRPEPELVARAIEAVEQVLAPFDARPHWAKLSGVSAAELRDRFPRLVEAARTRDAFDPPGVFRNDFLDRSLYG
jgi:xylitol oxidase